MSVQFGKWSFVGTPIDPTYIQNANRILRQYAPDGNNDYSRPGIHLSFFSLCEVAERRTEGQPYVSSSGRVFTWDGRLDNRNELIRQLGHCSSDSADVALVAVAYERWGSTALKKLLGDWALTVFSPNERTLVLAKDFLGSRGLYFFPEEHQVSWCTILDPLVLLAGKSWEFNAEYLAGWLTYFPAANLSPFVGIHSVPPSTFVVLKPGSHKSIRHWEFDSSTDIQYRSDSEYEEHFRTLFAESVRRRMRSEYPVLAELSGGIDSSSIVCMADALPDASDLPRLDTISFFNETEPNWNERPFFTQIEAHRGRKGCHIDLADSYAEPKLQSVSFAATPASIQQTPSCATEAFESQLSSKGYRVVLSGIGGDEVLGGVPTPLPELADLLRTMRLRTLARQLKRWALATRRPWIHLAFEVLSSLAPYGAFLDQESEALVLPWIASNFRKRFVSPLLGYPRRLRIFGPSPSFQMSLDSLAELQRQIATSPPSKDPPFYKRYPYLDRDLLEFLFAIPREQLVRPYERRSLMRRALAGIVPTEILNRRRKASASRGPAQALLRDWSLVLKAGRQPLTVSLGIADRDALAESMKSVQAGLLTPIVPLLRLMKVERWLSTLLSWPLSDLGIRLVDPHLVFPDASLLEMSPSARSSDRTSREFSVQAEKSHA